MQEQDLIKISEDLATIVAKKKKYHEEQISFHQSELNKLSAFAPATNGESHGLFGNTVAVKTKNNFDKPWWWEKNIAEMVNKYFPNTEFRNADLMEAANIPGLENLKYKKAVRYAISMALSAAVEGKILTYRQEIGIKGYIYKKK